MIFIHHSGYKMSFKMLIFVNAQAFKVNKQNSIESREISLVDTVWDLKS